MKEVAPKMLYVLEKSKFDEASLSLAASTNVKAKQVGVNINAKVSEKDGNTS